MDREPTVDRIDWSKTTWEGSRREQIRRWSRLSLKEIIQALEEMEILAEKLGHDTSRHIKTRD